MDFFHVVIDTSMLRQMHFQHPDFERLLLRSQKGLLKIYIPHIVKIVPEQSPAWSELAAALETTGVVVGEYGMAEAFELKRQDMLRWSTDEDANVRAFAAWLIEGLDKLIAWELQRADEGIELRKYRCGAGKDEA